MCIALITTAHPSYALIVINNRDEHILRPTSRPHWWSSKHQEVLSARDLQRSDHGTWLGITKKGNFAVLTNYREPQNSTRPVHGTRSRGAMVSAWLTSPQGESTEHFVHRLLGGEGVKGVGGFSLICGKLRKRKGEGEKQQIEPLAVISNRSTSPVDVSWMADERGEVYGLSNTSYTDPVEWPKVRTGKKKIAEAVENAVAKGLEENELVERLYAVLDTNTMPPKGDEGFEQYMYQLRNSIFIPQIGHVLPTQAPPTANAIASADPALVESSSRHRESQKGGYVGTQENAENGIYGTQRQTIVLIDWEGRVTYLERSLYDDEGNSLQKGEADVRLEFQIEGWDRKS